MPNFGGSGGASGYRNASHQEQQPDAIHDGAPGGLFFNESELPVAGTFSKPMTTGGFSPGSATRLPQDNPDPVAPSGLRR